MISNITFNFICDVVVLCSEIRTYFDQFVFKTIFSKFSTHILNHFKNTLI